jgi:hypothetical protein
VRKAMLARPLARKLALIVFNEHSDEDGATVFRHACRLGFEGIVSKRIEVKNADRPAMRRVRDCGRQRNRGGRLEPRRPRPQYLGCAAIWLQNQANTPWAMLPSLQRNEIGTSELDPFRSSILSPRSPL